MKTLAVLVALPALLLGACVEDRPVSRAGRVGLPPVAWPGPYSGAATLASPSPCGGSTLAASPCGRSAVTGAWDGGAGVTSLESDLAVYYAIGPRDEARAALRVPGRVGRCLWDGVDCAIDALIPDPRPSLRYAPIMRVAPMPAYSPCAPPAQRAAPCSPPVQRSPCAPPPMPQPQPEPVACAPDECPDGACTIAHR